MSPSNDNSSSNKNHKEKPKNFFVRRPDTVRRSFAIYSQELAESGKTYNTTIINKDIEALNFNFRRKLISYDEANRQVAEIRNRLAGRVPGIYNTQNESILENFFAAYFKKRPFVIDKESAKHKYKRAVRAIGKLSLLSITEDEALACVLNQLTNGKQREVAEKLNSLFEFLKRDIKCPIPRLEREPVVYVTETEINKLTTDLLAEAYNQSPEQANLTKYAANAFTTFFYAGLRHAEFRACKINSLSPDKKTLNIATQLDTKNKIRRPKNNKTRKAYIHSKGLPAFEACMTSGVLLSHKQLNEIFKRACAKHLKRFDLTIHDLRHSYAVFLLSLGVPKALLAQSMGNSERVIDDHYAGFILSDAGIETISRIMKD